MGIKLGIGGVSLDKIMQELWEEIFLVNVRLLLHLLLLSPLVPDCRLRETFS